ncbi:hypothetical protein P879_07729 [Paragonimus westermani]|uniref:Peptidase A2 domain-containing protein n=1 Tax=Paragonimus westermani TaxID=34504 RepID=A0A8T0DIL6_9TREM|nr:hypothetical protein P879_07729 [Paragonimus westermani]
MLLRDLWELASEVFEHLPPVDCERFCMSLRNRDPRNKCKNSSVALIKVRDCEAGEQLDKKRDAEYSICLAFRQHSLNPQPLLPQKRSAVLAGWECWYCKRFDRHARHCNRNLLTGPRSPKGEPLTLNEALPSVISPEYVADMKPISVVCNSNKKSVIFSVDTGASCSLMHARLATRLAKHRAAPENPVRLLAANGTEMQVTSSLLAGLQFGPSNGEHQFLACPNSQWEATLGVDFLGRS